jgi:hypothetical protein
VCDGGRSLASRPAMRSSTCCPLSLIVVRDRARPYLSRHAISLRPVVIQVKTPDFNSSNTHFYLILCMVLVIRRLLNPFNTYSTSLHLSNSKHPIKPLQTIQYCTQRSIETPRPCFTIN